jgi:hypothetical protein
MNAKQRNELLAMHAATTPGEWRYMEHDNILVTDAQFAIIGIQPSSAEVGIEARSANGKFFAAAHNIMPQLLRDFEELEAQRDEMSRILSARVRADLLDSQEDVRIWRSRPRSGGRRS